MRADPSAAIRVLLVEDEPADAELIAGELRRAGVPCELRTVSARDEFEAALRDWRPDVVLSDYDLPRFSAPGALAILHDGWPTVPLIVVTGTVDEATAVECVKAGAADYLFKGRLGRLPVAVRRALAERRLLEKHSEVRAQLDATQRSHLTVDAAHRQVQEELRKLSRAVEQSPVSIVITDTSGAIEYVNPKFTQVTGYSAAEVVGQNPRVLKSGHTPPEVYQELWRTILAGQQWRGEFRNRRKDGGLFWEEATISPIRDPEGHVTHFVAVKEDITDRKRAEEELRQTQQQLLQSQKMESIGRLAGGIAHDFNNLLTAINGFSELALEALSRDHPVRSDIEQIREAGQRAERLTRQLLAFSRRQVLEPRLLDLNEVVTGLLGMLRRVIGEHVDVTAKLADDLGPVMADPGQIEQVIVNLAVNARDAMPIGGRLIIETANVHLDADYIGHHPETRGGVYAMLAVSDTGCGMTEEVRRRAFEPFFTTKPKGVGSGLGLSMVYGIVRQSGGNVWLYSEPGHGTSVKIYLPRIDLTSDERRVVAAAPVRGDPVERGRGAILLVEDDLAVRALTGQWLQRYGYEVIEAESAAHALELGARDHLPIDLLLTDVVMPGLDGPSVARRLREMRPGLKVLYMSGYPDSALGAMSDLPARDGFLQKPFTAATLFSKVRAVVHPD